MVEVPAGWFLMGQDEEGKNSNRPQREVWVDGFAIGRVEVTNAEFAEFVRQTGYQTAGWDTAAAEEQPDYPVTGALWRDADAYCRWAGRRLPTEAEWEKAARGVDGRRYPWGDEWDPDLANTQESGSGGVLPVGSFTGGASPYGALDMAGNVAEWVADRFDFDYYEYAPLRNPRGPDLILDHGLRGGSWGLPHFYAQTFLRDSSHSVLPNPRVGFRCAADMTDHDG
jgi:formylglycine-generating enzyme required for sulfatase activity